MCSRTDFFCASANLSGSTLCAFCAAALPHCHTPALLRSCTPSPLTPEHRTSDPKRERKRELVSERSIQSESPNAGALDTFRHAIASELFMTKHLASGGLPGTSYVFRGVLAPSVSPRSLPGVCHDSICPGNRPCCPFPNPCPTPLPLFL